MATKPVRAQFAWKHADKRMDVFTKDLLKWLDPFTDSNETLAGVQNPFELDNITFRADCPGIDVFAIGIGAAGGHKSPGFWRAGLQLTMKEEGGIDANQTSFKILAPGSSLDIAVTDHLETPSGEIMRIEGVTTGDPNYTLTVERKAHGTDPAGVAYDEKLELLTPRVGMKRIILAGDTETLAAPVMATPQGMESGILLSWSHAYSTADLLRLKGWKIYYSATAEIDLEDPESYDGTFEIEGIDKTTIFNPRDAGLADVNTTYYFAMTALTKCLLESVLSNEVSGKVYGTIGPMPGGPVIPSCWISVDVAFRLLIEAGNNTDGQPQIGVQNVELATFEIYSAPMGQGNPTTGTPDGNQTLLGTLVDKSNPYSTKIGVTEYLDYWARVKFTDGEEHESGWGIAVYDPDTGATVLTLSKENNTTDTGVPGGVTIETRLITSYQTPGGIWRNRMLSGVFATSNIDSADRCQFFLRINGEGTFAAGNDDPFGVGTDRVIQVGGHPATCDYEYGEGQSLEITARIHNNFGWTPWTTPEELTLLKEFEGDDTDVCDLAGFGAWTLENPPPGGWSTDIPAPTGEEIVFTFDLGNTNESTVFQVSIEVEKSSSFPTETVRYSDSTSGLTLVGVAGKKTLILSGLDPDIEANVLEDKFIRIGRCPGKNIYETLQVLQIASNTASVDGVTTITTKGTEALYITSHYGASDVYQYWQIIDIPIWKLVDYYEDIPVKPEYFGALPAKTRVLKRNVTGVKCRARAHNQCGRGGYRESDSTAGGSATPGSAVYKSIGGIENDDAKDGTFKSIKTEKKLQAKFSSVRFTPTSNNSLAWSSGEIGFGDETSNSLGSGSKSSMGLNTKYWFYFTPGSGTRTVYGTTSQSDANSGTRVVIALALTTSNEDEMLTVEDLAGGGSTIGATSIIVKELAMLCGTAVYLTAGVVRTSPTAEDDGGIVLNASALTVYDNVGKKSVVLSEAGGLQLFDSNEDLALALTESGGRSARWGQIDFYYYGAAAGKIFGSSTNIKIDPVEDLIVTADNFALQENGSITITGNFLLLNSIIFDVTATTSYFKMRDEGGGTRYAFINAAGVWEVDASAPTP